MANRATLAAGVKEQGSLRVGSTLRLLPRDTGNVDFLIAHYSEVAPTRDDLSVSYVADFLNLRGTVVDETEDRENEP